MSSRKKPVKPEVKPEAKPEFVVSEEKVRVRKPAAVNNNAIIKSRLEPIIDMLSSDNDCDEKTLRHNVAISLKHLKEVIGML